MASSKKIVILHASAGHGHEKAALAVAEALSSFDCTVIVRDSLDLVPWFFGRFYKNSYLSMIKHVPFLWGWSYYTMDWSFLAPLIRPIRRLINSAMTQTMESFLESEKPDVLICTHFMSVEVAGAMKRRGTFSGKIMTIVTDYLPHAFWIHPSVDLYAVGCSKTREDLLRRGVPDKKIVVTGLPTMLAFRESVNLLEFRGEMGLAADLPTVLLTSGGAGVGAIGDVARELSSGSDAAQVLIVCGTNKALREKLSLASKANPLFQVFGFVNNMHQFMAVSDLLVGKAGGLTLAECFCKGLPIVMINPVPGQEERNAFITAGEGAGVLASSLSEALEKTRSILKNPARLSEMKSAAKRLGRPQAAADIAALALS